MRECLPLLIVRSLLCCHKFSLGSVTGPKLACGRAACMQARHFAADRFVLFGVFCYFIFLFFLGPLLHAGELQSCPMLLPAAVGGCNARRMKCDFLVSSASAAWRTASRPNAAQTVSAAVSVCVSCPFDPVIQEMLHAPFHLSKVTSSIPSFIILILVATLPITITLRSSFVTFQYRRLPRFVPA